MASQVWEFHRGEVDMVWWRYICSVRIVVTTVVEMALAQYGAIIREVYVYLARCIDPLRKP